MNNSPTTTRSTRYANPTTRGVANDLTRFRAATRPMKLESLEGRQLFSGLSATYFSNSDFTGTTYTRIDANVNFDWGSGAPDSTIGSDTFSARWVGQVRAAYTEQYTFKTTADDGARLWVNDQLVIDNWSKSGVASGKINLEAGKLYNVQLEYHEESGQANCTLSWSSPSRSSQVIPTNMLYPPSAPATPLPKLVQQSPGTANVQSYGAKGNGTTDDAAAIQRAIDDLPSFGTLQLEPRTYKINKQLIIHKPMNIQGNGALILLNTSNYPDNHAIAVSSTLDNSRTVSWTENVTAGQSTFHPTFAAGKFSVGQWVFLELGQDPNDAHEQHYTAMVPVTAVGTNSITLGTTVPYDIVQGAFTNKITAISSLATQVHIRDIKFDHVDGTVPDTSIWFGLVRNSSIDGVSGRANILLNVSDSANITLRNVNATLNDGHSAAGRVLTAWQNDNLVIENIKADTSANKAVFFVESWSRNTSFNNIDVKWRYNQSATAAIYHLTGGSYGTLIDNTHIDNSQPIQLVGSGSQKADFHFKTATVRGDVTTVALKDIDDLTTGARRFADSVHVVKTFNLTAGLTDKRIDLFNGSIKSVKVSVNKNGGMKGMYLLNAIGQGEWVADSQLTPDVPLTLWKEGMIGAAYPFNVTAGTMKLISLYTPASVVAGAVLTLDIEYYPTGG